MSAGLGAVERAAMATIAEHPNGIHVVDVARHIHGGHPTVSQYESVRRAVATLVRDGAVSKFWPMFRMAPWVAPAGRIVTHRPRKCWSSHRRRFAQHMDGAA